MFDQTHSKQVKVRTAKLLLAAPTAERAAMVISFLHCYTEAALFFGISGWYKR